MGEKAALKYRSRFKSKSMKRSNSIQNLKEINLIALVSLYTFVSKIFTPIRLRYYCTEHFAISGAGPLDADRVDAVQP